MTDIPNVTIEPWGEGDLPVLERSNVPAMMEHLGGPETPEKLLVRHARYLDGWRSGSSIMCRKAGFTLLGEVDDEYPPGSPIRSNDWVFNLRSSRAG